MTGVWHLDLDLDMITGVWHTCDPNLGSLYYYKFWFGLWRILEIHGLYLASLALENAAGSWLGFDILILIWIMSLVFDTPMFQILALYINIEGAKNIHVIWVLTCGLWGHGGFLTRVWQDDLDQDMGTGLWCTLDPNFGCLCWFWRCKEHPCPLNPDLRLWLGLQVPDWGLASWSWFGYCHWFFIQPCFK